MKKALLVISLLFLFGSAIQAQTQTKKERIKYLFSLMHQDSMISKMTAGMTTFWAKSMRQQNEDNDSPMSTKDSTDKATKKAASLDQYTTSIMKLMNEDMINSYDKHFTSAEIEDFITFYASKSGQKMLLETPDITKELFENMATEKYQSKIKAFAKKEVEEQQ